LIISTKKIFGRPQIQYNRNAYNRVNWEETKYREEYEENFLDLIRTTKIDLSKWEDYVEEYNLQLVTANDGRLWLVGNFIAKVEDSKYYDIRFSAEPYWEIFYDGGNTDKDEMSSFSDMNEFISYVRGKSNVTATGGLINITNLADNGVYAFGVNTNIVKYDFFIIYGGPVEMFYYEKEKVIRSITAPNTNGNNVWTLETNEMFTTVKNINYAGIGLVTLGEYRAREKLDEYTNGKQTVNVDVAITPDGFFYAEDFANRNYNTNYQQYRNFAKYTDAYIESKKAKRSCLLDDGTREDRNTFIEKGDIVCPMRLLRKEYTPIRKKDYFGFPLEIAQWTNHEEPLSKNPDGSATEIVQI
jgi:hypothetical protein